jgi:hypothetical protein
MHNFVCLSVRTHLNTKACWGLNKFTKIQLILQKKTLVINLNSVRYAQLCLSVCENVFKYTSLWWPKLKYKKFQQLISIQSDMHNFVCLSVRTLIYQKFQQLISIQSDMHNFVCLSMRTHLNTKACDRLN